MVGLHLLWNTCIPTSSLSSSSAILTNSSVILTAVRASPASSFSLFCLTSSSRRFLTDGSNLHVLGVKEDDTCALKLLPQFFGMSR
jgi:hypothetical protein